MADLDVLVSGLRRWAEGKDGHVRAAVELIIGQGRWLARESFTEACVRSDGGESWIDWHAARSYAAGDLPASGSEIALLRIAVAIGSDQYRLSRMDDGQAEAIVQAMATALALKVEVTGG